jgi:hypothetical protein
MPIKPASERRLIGHSADALDIPAKTNGTTRYGIDARVEGMVYARPKIPPPATDRRFARSTILPPKASRATSSLSRSTTRPARRRAG